jgi:AcrR family transcriptional regulator
MGLRERQKANRTANIIAVAAELFRTQGFDAARVEDIAALAEVSPGTVYNYFPTKGDLLVAIVTQEVEEVLAAGEAVVANPGPDVAAAIGALVNAYYDHSLIYLSKEMWATAMAMTFSQADTPASRHYLALDARLRGQVVALIAALQARGRVVAGADAVALGAVVFHNLDAMFAGFVRSDQGLDGLKAVVAMQNAEIARLIAV